MTDIYSRQPVSGKRKSKRMRKESDIGDNCIDQEHDSLHIVNYIKRQKTYRSQNQQEGKCMYTTIILKTSQDPDDLIEDMVVLPLCKTIRGAFCRILDHFATSGMLSFEEMQYDEAENRFTTFPFGTNHPIDLFMRKNYEKFRNEEICLDACKYVTQSMQDLQHVYVALTGSDWVDITIKIKSCCITEIDDTDAFEKSTFEDICEGEETESFVSYSDCLNKH